MLARSRKAGKRLGKTLAGAILTLLVAGFLGSAMIRFAPGYESDERTLDRRYSDVTTAAIARDVSQSPNVFVSYGRYIVQAMHGDFGTSRLFSIPVGELIRSRLSVTARLVGSGMLAGWLCGLGLAAAAVYFRSTGLSLGAEALSGLALSLPAAVFALLVFLAKGPVWVVLALAVFPRVFRYARDLFGRARVSPSVEAARCRGIAEPVIFFRYVMRSAWAPLVALAGVSFSIAFGALIPVEVVCDVPGIGQLAWRAALARDLPVLVTVTLLVTVVTVVANSFADLAAGVSEP